ncbi:MAG: hypothetical protein ACE144_18895 [Thermodesulfobacteriota bacterium]
MSELRIKMVGSITKLAIGTFPKRGADWVHAYYEELKPYTDFEEIWYGEGLIPEEYTKGKDPTDLDDIYHEFGLTFNDKDEVDAFLRGILTTPKIKAVYLNGKRMNYDLSRVVSAFDRLDLGKVSRNSVYVYYGSVYSGEIDYALSVPRQFDPERLRMRFANCSEYGYMLTQMHYDGRQAKRFYGGTKLQIRLGIYSEFMKRMKFQKLLEPKFRTKLKDYSPKKWRG